MWAKKAANDERHQREIYESKLKDLEKKLNNICCSGNMTEVKVCIIQLIYHSAITVKFEGFCFLVWGRINTWGLGQSFFFFSFVLSLIKLI